MKIANAYNHLNGLEFLMCRHPKLLKEIKDAVASIDANLYIKKSKEAKKIGKHLALREPCTGFQSQTADGGGMQHDRIKRGEFTWKHGQQPARPVRISCYENHATDARIKDISVAPTGGGSHDRVRPHDDRQPVQGPALRGHCPGLSFDSGYGFPVLPNLCETLMVGTAAGHYRSVLVERGLI